MKHRLLLIGFGTVAQGLTEILTQKRQLLKAQYGFEYEIVGVCDWARGNIYNPDGLDSENLLEIGRYGSKFTQYITHKDTLTIIKESNATIVCEMTFTNLTTGGPALEHCTAALSSGKHVVTSNKGPAALQYDLMQKLAAEHNVKFYIEGTVLSGTTVINLAAIPLAGCQIERITGILNGTTNYMLNLMEEGIDYQQALAKAQELGFAEADPTGDVEGYDARAKITILANVVMNASLKITDVNCKGITNLTTQDIQDALKQGKRWKLIGSVEKTAQGIKASVAPQMIALSHPLANINGAINALTFKTDMLGEITIIGPGAGRTETGYSILTDILRIHNQKCVE